MIDAADIKDLQLQGRRVLLRVDFNVPLRREGGRMVVADDLRLRAALPTVRALLAAGARPILMSHLGRPKGLDEALRLAPVGERLAELSGLKLRSIPVSTGPAARQAAADLKAGELLLLENLRFDPGEQDGSEAFIASLVELGQAYVNDAFGTMHRPDASIIGPPRHLPSALGILARSELAALDGLRTAQRRPYVLVLGGAKVSDKIGLFERLLEQVDRVLIGGAMAYTFLLAEGLGVGASRAEKEALDQARHLRERARERGVGFELPGDHVVAAKLDDEAGARVVRGDIPAGAMGLDIGPETSRRYSDFVAAAGTVFWNGPLGVFERPAFAAGTRAVLQALDLCRGYRVVGGGDTAAACEALGSKDPNPGYHVSTGGGASLSYLEGEALPGLVALAQGRPRK